MELIDRQELLRQIDIDAGDEPGYYGDTWKFIDTIKNMPSATDTNVGTKLSTNLAEVGTDCINRQAAIDAFNTGLNELVVDGEENAKTVENYLNRVIEKIKCLPPAQPEPCEYYALCRHGRDERKLRSALGRCEYCNKDSDGYVKPIEKNNHAFVRFGMDGWELSLKARGWHGSAKIRYCPMCGRDLLVK